MLQVFFGNDTDAVRDAALRAMREQEASGKRVERIDSDTYVPGIFSDSAGATSLFGEETCYLVDSPRVKVEMEDAFVAALPALAESNNHFIVIDGPLLAPAKKQLAKVTDDVEEFSKPASERFNTFAMADALANKQKRDLWMKLQAARAAGIAAEEIIGVLWWQLKSLRLASETATASAAGMKDFPYKKAKGALRNFTNGEVVALSDSLLTVYHDGHDGRRDIDDALEAWVLEM